MNGSVKFIVLLCNTNNFPINAVFLYIKNYFCYLFYFFLKVLYKKKSTANGGLQQKEILSPPVYKKTTINSYKIYFHFIIVKFSF